MKYLSYLFTVVVYGLLFSTVVIATTLQTYSKTAQRQNLSKFHNNFSLNNVSKNNGGDNFNFTNSSKNIVNNTKHFYYNQPFGQESKQYQFLPNNTKRYDVNSVSKAKPHPISREPVVRYQNVYQKLRAFNNIYGNIHGYLSLLICIFGLVTNMLNVAVLSNRKMLNPTNIILIGIAVADILVMMSYLIFASYMYIPMVKGNLHSHAWAYFILFHFNLTMLAHTISTWVTVFLAAFRCLSLSQPTLRKRYFDNRTTALCLVTIYVCVSLCCLPYYLSYTIIPYDPSPKTLLKDAKIFYQTFANDNSTMGFKFNPNKTQWTSRRLTTYKNISLYPNTSIKMKNSRSVFDLTGLDTQTVVRTSTVHSLIKDQVETKIIYNNDSNSSFPLQTTTMLKVLRMIPKPSILYITSTNAKHANLHQMNFIMYSVIGKLLPCLMLTIMSAFLIYVICRANYRHQKLKIGGANLGTSRPQMGPPNSSLMMLGQTNSLDKKRSTAATFYSGRETLNTIDEAELLTTIEENCHAQRKRKKYGGRTNYKFPLQIFGDWGRGNHGTYKIGHKKSSSISLRNKNKATSLFKGFHNLYRDSGNDIVNEYVPYTNFKQTKYIPPDPSSYYQIIPDDIDDDTKEVGEERLIEPNEEVSRDKNSLIFLNNDYSNALDNKVVINGWIKRSSSLAEPNNKIISTNSNGGNNWFKRMFLVKSSNHKNERRMSTAKNHHTSFVLAGYPKARYSSSKSIADKAHNYKRKSSLVLNTAQPLSSSPNEVGDGEKHEELQNIDIGSKTAAKTIITNQQSNIPNMIKTVSYDHPSIPPVRIDRSIYQRARNKVSTLLLQNTTAINSHHDKGITGSLASRNEEGAVPLNNNPNVAIQNLNLNLSRRVPRRRYRGDKTSQLLLTVLLCFLVTEFPSGLLALLCIKDLLGQPFFNMVYSPLGDLMDTMALINSSINFIVYCTMSEQFRSSFKEMLNVIWSKLKPFINGLNSVKSSINKRKT